MEPGPDSVQVGEVESVEVGESQATDGSLAGQCHRDRVADGEPHDTDSGFREAPLLLIGDLEPVPAGAQLDEVVLGKGMDEPSAPRVVEPTARGVGVGNEL